MNGVNNQYFASSKQQVQTQSHTYLSSIRDLQASDAEENLKKKREQQIAFAESLRKQIDEKRQRIHQQQPNQKRNINQQFKDTQRNEPHFTFGKESETSEVTKPQNFPYFQPKESAINSFGNDENFDFSFSVNVEPLTSKNDDYSYSQSNSSSHPRRQILTKADLSQFDKFSSSSINSGNSSFCRHGTIQINTDSPFATSTVATPPQGFSIRRHPISQPMNFLQPQTEYDQIDFKSSNSRFDNSECFKTEQKLSTYSQRPLPRVCPQRQTKFNYTESNENLQISPSMSLGLSNTITKKINYRPPQVHPRAKSVLLQPVEKMASVPLDAVSELVYPDGHLSPAVSSRDI